MRGPDAARTRIGLGVDQPRRTVGGAAALLATWLMRGDHVGGMAFVDAAGLRVQRPGPVAGDRLLGGPIERRSRQDDRLEGRLQRRRASAGVAVGLRHPRPVQPGKRVADLKAAVLQPAGEAVEGPRRAEGEQVCARLHHPRALRRPQATPGLEGLIGSEPLVAGAGGCLADRAGVPVLVLPADPVRRVGDDRVDAFGLQFAQHLQAVAFEQPHGAPRAARLMATPSRRPPACFRRPAHPDFSRTGFPSQSTDRPGSRTSRKTGAKGPSHRKSSSREDRVLFMHRPLGDVDMSAKRDPRKPHPDAGLRRLREPRRGPDRGPDRGPRRDPWGQPSSLAVAI